MLSFFPIAVAFLLLVYEYRNYRLLKKAKFLYEKDGVKYYEIEGDEDNAITIKSVVFGKNVIIIGKKNEKILAHEEGHLKQPYFMYYFFVISAFLIAYNIFTIPLLLFMYKLMFLHYERAADLYAYNKYHVKFESTTARPAKRIDRIRAWIFDTHPPDWVRAKEEKYYEKKNSLIKLLLNDLLS
nr:conjugal transfer protein [Sulfolobus islandicus]